jgi:hypothetical protein
MPERVPPDRDQRKQAITQFADELQALRAAIGNPSFRKLAGRSGRISHTALHDAVAGNRLASWTTTREFVRACGGDEAAWRARWERAAALALGQADESSPDGPATSENGAGPAESEPAGPEPATPPAPLATSGAPAGSEPVQPKASRPARRFSRKIAVVAGTITILVAVGGAGLMLRSGSDETPDPAAATPAGPRVSGDRSRFIADATIPDGTSVKTNETFVKVWEIQNSGTVPWYGRYLQREDLPPAPGSCRTPDRVPIGNTLPNERVKISVTVTAPDRPGSCMVKWKMVDEQGRLFFPSSRPVYFLVTVVAPEEPSPEAAAN